AFDRAVASARLTAAGSRCRDGGGCRLVRRLYRKTGFVFVEFLQQLTPLAELLLRSASQLQSAAFDLHDHRLNLGLEGIAELLQRVGMHLHLCALVEAALDCVRPSENRARSGSTPRIGTALVADHEAADDCGGTEQLARERRTRRFVLRLELVIAVATPIRVWLCHVVGEQGIVL